MSRYGVVWPDNTETGPLTDLRRLASHYAKNPGIPGLVGRVKDYDSGETTEADNNEEPHGNE